MNLNGVNNFITINFNKFKMITDVELTKNGRNKNQLIIEINKNYETSIILDYDARLEDGILFLVDNNLKKINKNRLNSIESGILNLISINISQNLINKITKRKTYYISPPIPLIGHTAFGLIDRGTNIIQVRGLSGCNINCPFCSVDEGQYSKTRKNDYYVDLDYLVDEYKKIVEFKGNKHLEAHLDGQGEPSLYYPLPDLVQKLNEINSKGNGIVTMQSNGTKLSYKLIDELEEAGLHRINLSINALNEKMSRILSGSRDYNINHILDIAEYIKNSKIHLLIAPLLLPNINDEEFKKVIDYAVQLERKNPQNIINPITNKKNPIIGAQLCLTYQFGRRIKKMKVWNFKKFYELLKHYENEYKKNGIDVQLDTPLSKAFGNHRRKKLFSPFKLNEIVKAEVVLDGRVNNEVIGVAKDRVIQIINVNKNYEKIVGKIVKVRILRTKDNIFVGALV
ncbi:radical SAM protein [Methanothermococcus okinawensis]|uniref:Radical SAM domain protein n=1 Tax=Methanothermococcus okinawensis (strain DSM 14208 / JCM 11175 / IH1) TaxID=647113 RepID=F8AK83_METOI|nr:radical SAM protein [Methanothermococcus okinawensis]AEH07454.1 Radical SAM domain protein [Methanothermococcus okinawensis IH1]